MRVVPAARAFTKAMPGSRYEYPLRARLMKPSGRRAGLERGSRGRMPAPWRSQHGRHDAMALPASLLASNLIFSHEQSPQPEICRPFELPSKNTADGIVQGSDVRALHANFDAAYSLGMERFPAHAGWALSGAVREPVRGRVRRRRVALTSRNTVAVLASGCSEPGRDRVLATGEDTRCSSCGRRPSGRVRPLGRTLSGIWSAVSKEASTRPIVLSSTWRLRRSLSRRTWPRDTALDSGPRHRDLRIGFSQFEPALSRSVRSGAATEIVRGSFPRSKHG